MQNCFGSQIEFTEIKMDVSRKKLIIFYAGVLLMFMTSMNKVLVPNAVFDELQNELGISGKMLAAMGAGFMYTYAVSQLALGLLSSKFGGVRILLFGAAVFALGSVIFPFLSSAELMVATRTLTGLGAGTVFIGLAKLMADLFEKNFSFVLGAVLFFTYFGPVTGNLPMVSLVKATSWRTAMAVPAVISVMILLTMIIFMKGTLKPVVKGDAWSPLFVLCRNRNSWLIFVASSVVFGSYYLISTTAGNKILTDIGKLPPLVASTAVTVFAVIVAVNNIFGNFVLKLMKNRRKVMMFCAGLSHFAGTVICTLAFFLNWHVVFIICGFVLIAIPAGLFSIYCTVIKELHPAEFTGLAIAILNFFAFVAIAGYGNIAGAVFSRFENGAISGAVKYPPEAYGIIFGIFAVLAFCGFVCALLLPETYKNRLCTKH